MFGLIDCMEFLLLRHEQIFFEHDVIFVSFFETTFIKIYYLI